MAELLPQYRIECLLGAGGMGAVYKGFQPELERPVAIKLLPVEAAANAAFVAQFDNEARTLARLRHARIVTIYEFGRTSAGHLFFVMEYIDGSHLRTVLGESGFTPERALLIASQVCDALEAAERSGIVHGDIKPENILLTHDGSVKLIDFGLASSMRDPKDGPASETIFGTPEYAAPEVRAGKADRRADIYALGVVLYEMLTGEIPGNPYEPAWRKANTDPQIDQIVRRALQPRPEQRYQHARDFKTAVDLVRTAPGPSAPAAAPHPLPPLAPAHVRRAPLVAAPRPRSALKTTLLIAMDATLIAFSIWWLWTRLQPAPGKVKPAGMAGSEPVRQESSSVPASTPSVAKAGADPILGRWNWRRDTIVTFAADGSLLRNDGASGRWNCQNPTEAARTYTLKWKGGNVDVLSLIKNNMVLEGRRTNGGDLLTASRAAIPNLPAPPSRKELEAGFTPLLDGTHQDGWKHSGPGSMQEKNGVFTTFTPEGSHGLAWYAARQFSDFVLRFDFAADSGTSNSGVYLRLPLLGERKPPLAFPNSYEVEIRGDETGTFPFHKARPDLLRSINPQTWHECEITAIGQEYEVKLDGVVVNRYIGSKATSGYLALQNMDAPGEVHFSSVRIKELLPTPAPTNVSTAAASVTPQPIEEKPVRLNASLPPAISRFSFDGMALESGAVLGKSKQHHGVLDLDVSNETYMANPPVGFRSPGLNYRAFTVAVRLRPDLPTTGGVPLLVAGRGYRWLGLRASASGDLSFHLNNWEFKHAVPNVKVKAGQWTTLLVTCDFSSGKAAVFVNGARAAAISLPPNLKIQVLGTNAEPSDKAWMFMDYATGARLSGAVDELLVFGSVLSDAQISQLTRDLHREPATTASASSVTQKP